MNSIFWELFYKGVSANYIDDFVILAKTITELECYKLKSLELDKWMNLVLG